ncbi:uncharacterized protein TNCV_2885171 [Trichonephila clavipes]|nr:uncharacterized protein TNCV_2885171 [Trichonephila clavipes]
MKDDCLYADFRRQVYINTFASSKIGISILRSRITKKHITYHSRSSSQSGTDIREQWEIQHVEIDKRWVKIFNHSKNEPIPNENLVILVDLTMCCPGTNAADERIFSIDNDFGQVRDQD